MSWADVDRKTGGGRYFSLEDGETKRIRLLDEEPHTVLIHKISQIVDDEEVFITVPATPKADDDFINQHTNRYPAVAQHNMRCVVFNDDGEPEAVQVLGGGVQIFRPLKTFYQRYGDLRDIDIEISREGEGRQTQYHVTTAPNTIEIDIDEWIEEMEGDEALSWDTLFPPITPEEQEKMIDEVGIDITYDPVIEIMEEMELDEALETHISFGKYGPDKYPPKGKTIGEIFAIDSGYLEWVAEKATSDDTIAAAARIAVEHAGEIERPKKAKKAVSSGTKKSKKSGSGTKAKSGSKTTKKAKKSRSKKAKKKADDEPSRDELISEINAAFDESDEYTEAMEIVEVIKKHGNGKTKIKDLTIEEMQSLLEDLR